MRSRIPACIARAAQQPGLRAAWVGDQLREACLEVEPRVSRQYGGHRGRAHVPVAVAPDIEPHRVPEEESLRPVAQLDLRRDVEADCLGERACENAPAASPPEPRAA
jgi:hypothetical protein